MRPQSYHHTLGLLRPLTPLDDITSPSPSHNECLTSSPLNSLPASPSLEKKHPRIEPPPSPLNQNVALLLPSLNLTRICHLLSLLRSHPRPSLAPPDEARPHTYRYRRDSSPDDKPWFNRKRQSQVSSPNPTPAQLPPPRTSSSSTTATLASASNPTSVSASASPTSLSLNDESKEPDAHLGPDPNNMDHDDDSAQQCPHPTFLGVLIEAFAISRTPLPLSILTCTTPALAGYLQAVLTTTLAWAVSVRILGWVRLSGESRSSSYFYDPAADSDRERGALLRYLIPRPGKRQETMCCQLFTIADDTLPQILLSSKVISPDVSILPCSHATHKFLSASLWL